MRRIGLVILVAVFGSASGATAAAAATPAARIVAQRAGDLFTVLPDGTALHRLTATDRLESAPAWSPSHQTIAFVSARRSIHVVDATGRGERRIFRLPAGFDWVGSIAWSPTGSELAFTSVRQRRTTHGPRICGQVWVIGASGSDPHTILTGRLSPAGLSWSPDGRSLVAAFEVPNMTVPCRKDGKAGLFLFGTDGSGVRSLGATFATNPDWSPDGRHIAFRDWRRVCHACGEIWEMRPDGSHQHPIASPSGSDLGFYAPAWSPDGRFLSFIDQRNGRFSLWRMRSDGTHRHLVRRNVDEADW
jgi:TolB protein